MTPSTIPLSLSQKLAALGIREESYFVWKETQGRNNDELILTKDIREQDRFFNFFPAYTLGEFPAVLKAIGKVKGWPSFICSSCHKEAKEAKSSFYFKCEDCGLLVEENYAEFPVTHHFLEICRLYSDSPEKGWEYLEELIK